MGIVFDITGPPFKIQRKKNKIFLRELTKAGLDVKRIESILISHSKKAINEIYKDEKKYKHISYSIRKVKSVINDEFVSDRVKFILENEELKNLYFLQKYYKFGPFKQKAKSWKQELGFQVVGIHSYTKPFWEQLEESRKTKKKRFFQKDIFELIAELLNSYYNIQPGVNFKRVETLYFNNI
jgi:hypothetical protein